MKFDGPPAREELRALEQPSEDFAGRAVMISHECWFLDRIAMTEATPRRGRWIWLAIPGLLILVLFLPGVFFTVKQAGLPGTQGEKGAPGIRDEDQIFYWRPQLCFDGLCVQTHAARRPVWDGFRLYYPRKNQVVAVRWQSPAVSTAFRRREKSS
jgi:hypothetical protein